jgi:dihydrofolate synthase/folylpolyglutamate synthase
VRPILSSPIVITKKWSDRCRRDDGEQQPVSPVEREFGLESHGKRHGLEVIRAMMGAWGNPQQRYPTIHVAGSKGKGSTVAILSSILRAAGYRVGSYTSPSLTQFGERIQVGGVPMSDEAAEAYVAEVAGMTPLLPDRPRFFEAATGIAFQHFARERVDVAVIEVGLGGRLDATNIIVPELSIITSIELEHTQILGDTLGEIATEKAGIVKPGISTLTAVSNREALEPIREICEERGARLWRLGEHFEIGNVSNGVTQQRFDFHGGPESGDRRMDGLCLNLAGEAQCCNAALAVAASGLLRGRLERITEAAVRQGLGAVRWPGRLELIPSTPSILLDVAHTPASAAQLRRHLEQFFPSVPKTLVVGMLRDKRHSEVACELSSVFDRIIVAPVKWFRSLEAEVLREAFAMYHSQVDVAPTVCEALECAVAMTPPAGLVVVAGSLFAVGEVKRRFGLAA